MERTGARGSGDRRTRIRGVPGFGAQPRSASSPRLPVREYGFGSLPLGAANYWGGGPSSSRALRGSGESTGAIADLPRADRATPGVMVLGPPARGPTEPPRHEHEEGNAGRLRSSRARQRPFVAAAGVAVAAT